MKLALKLLSFVFITVLHAQQPIGKTQVIKKEAALSCVSGDCVNGWGKWEFENGYYDGFWENGKREGYGLYKWNEYGTYIGFWKNDKMEGYGSYEDADGKIMAGMYANGKLNGIGEESTLTSEFKRGIYKDHVLATPYDFYINDAKSGCVSGNCNNLYGKYVWDNGDYFTGFFQNGVPLLGRYQFKNGDVYNGMFNSKGQFHGQGRFFYANKNGYYAGDFVNGNFNGKGYYHDKDYYTKIGVWENGILITSLKN